MRTCRDRHRICPSASGLHPGATTPIPTPPLPALTPLLALTTPPGGPPPPPREDALAYWRALLADHTRLALLGGWRPEQLEAQEARVKELLHTTVRLR